MTVIVALTMSEEQAPYFLDLFESKVISAWRARDDGSDNTVIGLLVGRAQIEGRVLLPPSQTDNRRGTARRRRSESKRRR